MNDKQKSINPKILVGIVCSDYHEYCLNEFLEGLDNLTYKNKDILFVDNSKTNNFANKLKKRYNIIKIDFLKGAINRIVKSRNILREYTLKHNYDYFFSLEQDVIPPEDIIERLLKLNKPISTGLYFRYRKLGEKGESTQPIAFAWLDIKKNIIRQLSCKEMEKPQIITVLSGLGCILIYRSVLEKLKFRYKKHGPGEDFLFCKDAKNEGIKVIMDTSIKCKHLIKNRQWYLDPKKDDEPIIYKH